MLFFTNKQQLKMDVGGYALCFRPLLGGEGVHFTRSVQFFLILSPPPLNLFFHSENENSWQNPKKPCHRLFPHIRIYVVAL